jgi:hypothetical protein
MLNSARDCHRLILVSRRTRLVKSFVEPEGVWRGRIWSAARFGLPAGMTFTALQFVLYREAGQAALEGVFFGGFLGAWMAFVTWRRWPDAAHLTPDARVAVVRIVRRGETFRDARLAPAVLGYVAVIRSDEDRARRSTWVLWIITAVTLSLALGESLNGSTRGAAVFWVLTVLLAGLFARLPRQRARLLANATRAEATAAKMLV